MAKKNMGITIHGDLFTVLILLKLFGYLKLSWFWIIVILLIF